MKQYKMARAILITVPVFFFATFSAGAETEPGDEEAAAVSAEEIAPADAIDTVEVTEATGLDMIMDGSSLEAFEKSMEKVRETGSEADYKSLKGAFDYLLFYDLGARHNREKLAARLDGKTGYEIIDRVKWRKSR